MGRNQLTRFRHLFPRLPYFPVYIVPEYIAGVFSCLVAGLAVHQVPAAFDLLSIAGRIGVKARPALFRRRGHEHEAIERDVIVDTFDRGGFLLIALTG